MSEYLYITCSCGHENVVRMYPATLVDPGYPDQDTCDGCGEYLDFEDAEPTTLEELKYANDPRV